MTPTANMTAFIDELQSKPGDAKTGAREVFAEIARSMGTKIDLHDIFYGLADGYEDSISQRSLCRVLGHLCKYLTPTGALIVLAVGIFSGLDYLRKASAKVLSGLSAAFRMLGNPLGTAAAAAATWFADFLSPTKKDGVSDSTVGILSAIVMADLPASIIAAVGMTNTSMGLEGTRTSSSTYVPSRSAAPAGGDDDALVSAITAGVVKQLKSDSRRVNAAAVMSDARRLVRDGNNARDCEQRLMSKYGR